MDLLKIGMEAWVPSVETHHASSACPLDFWKSQNYGSKLPNI
jgi:hypothetical protein